MSHEYTRPATTGGWTISYHRTFTDVASARAAAEPILAARAGGAFVQSALATRQHRINDDPLTYTPVTGGTANLDHAAHVFVAERERESTKRLECERVVGRQSRQIAAAHTTQRGFDAHPVWTRQRRRFHVVQRHTAERTQRQRRPFTRSHPREKVADRTVMEPKRAHTRLLPASCGGAARANSSAASQ